MGKFGFNPTKLIQWNDADGQLKYHTEYKKRPLNYVHVPKEKYSTAPYASKSAGGDNNKAVRGAKGGETSQHDYMKRHLYVKSCVDSERPEWTFQAQKVSIRNYTPKAINQEINMGMWI